MKIEVNKDEYKYLIKKCESDINVRYRLIRHMTNYDIPINKLRNDKIDKLYQDLKFLHLLNNKLKD